MTGVQTCALPISALEAPALTAFALDLDDDSPQTVAARLVDELLRGGLEREVGYLDGQRWSLSVVARPAAQADLPIGPGDVVVVSGGGRGVTASCVTHLAHVVPARFVLLGRTPLEEEGPLTASAPDEAGIKRALVQAARDRGEAPAPAEIGRATRRILALREIHQTLDRIAEAGAEATYLSVDVSDAAELGRALDAVRRRWGPIKALVHGAGVIHDKRITDKTLTQVDHVIRTKIGGLEHLLAATAEDPLQAILLFSSVAGYAGNLGQADYAMANAALDAIAAAEAAARPGCRIKSLGWGPWRGGMVDPALEARFEAAGVPLVAIEDGARWMAEELRAPGSPRVLLGGPPSAGPLLPGASPRQERLRISVDRARFPELDDHVIEGTAVVPVVQVAEWMIGAVAGCFPGARSVQLEGLQVRRGVTLPADPEEALELTLVAEVVGETARLSLEDASGHGRYGAPGRPLDVEPPTTPNPPQLNGGPPPEPYGGVLFHGPRYQALHPLEALDGTGARARLLGAGRLGWQRAPTSADPARMDGALQLGVLVAERLLDGASLPTRIDRLAVDLSARDPGPGPAWSVTRARSSDQVTHDVVAEDGAGRRALVVEGYVTTRRPGWTRG